MKKLVLLFMIAFTPIANAQDAKPITTEEEYNYLTKGYELQLQNGADFKSGYELLKIDELKVNGYIVTYSLMKESSSKQTKAVSIVLTKEKDKKDKVVYLCLPFNNPDLLQKFYKDTESIGISMKVVFEISVYNNLSRSMDKISNRCK
jgi:hypothetical protein